MAKLNDTFVAKTPEPVAAADKAPEQALKDDWPTKHNQLAPYITAKGKMRSGLKPSDQAKAKDILRSYGF